jgi:hypothetical protein
MKLSQLSSAEAALLCWSVELALGAAESSSELQLLEQLLSRCSLQLPYAPFSSASDWRAAQLTS